MKKLTNRISKLRAEFIPEKVQAMIISDRVNMEYLTGFTGSYGFLLVTKKEVILFTDARYYHGVAGRLKGVTVRLVSDGFPKLLNTFLRKKRISYLGFETGALTYYTWREWKKALVGIKLVPVIAVIEYLRMLKDPGEIRAIRDAVRIVDKVIGCAKKQIKKGISEWELARKLENKIRSFDQGQPSFPIIVAVGRQAAVPHAQPSRRQLANNQLVLIDLGAQKKGYSSDLTRTFWLGRITRKFEQVYNAVLTAQQLAIAKIAPGVMAAEVDRAARDYIKEQGFGKYFTHALGHGIGKAVHELPRINRKSKVQLKPGMVFSVEPGIYIPGWGGVRIEDLVLVTKKGHEVLTKTPKNLDQVKL